MYTFNNLVVKWCSAEIEVEYAFGREKTGVLFLLEMQKPPTYSFPPPTRKTQTEYFLYNTHTKLKI